MLGDTIQEIKKKYKNRKKQDQVDRFIHNKAEFPDCKTQENSTANSTGKNLVLKMRSKTFATGIRRHSLLSGEDNKE